MSRAAVCGCANWPGSAATLSTAELSGLPPSTTCSCPTAIVTPMPASMACTIAGLIASAPRATRTAPSASWASPARTVMAQVARQPYRCTSSAVTTSRLVAAPLTWRGAPPSIPATMPPTAAATRPAWRGAPVARARPSESGTAIRKTTTEADRSPRRAAARSAGGGGWVRGALGAPVGPGGPGGFCSCDIPVSSGAARSRGARSWAAVYCGGTRAGRLVSRFVTAR